MKNADFIAYYAATRRDADLHSAKKQAILYIFTKIKYVNFLGVKNIFDKNDVNHGVYEVKRGFGGQTIEYIGEFDLPINKLLYKLYKLKSKIKK